MRTEVDQDICIGDGVCADICPDVFEMHDDNLAYVKIDGDIPASLADSCREACDACPVEAIKITE